MNASVPVLVAVAILALAPCRSGFADVYAWKDAATGRTKISNLAPPWYKRGEEVAGPDVVVNRGPNVIDDTRLPLARRRELLGMPDARRSEKANAPDGNGRPPVEAVAAPGPDM
jgi:hypothetical protein